VEEVMYELVAKDPINGMVHLEDVRIIDIAPNLCS
jgi:hypothetical protein